jgi:RNA polymerase primary sigma factor
MRQLKISASITNRESPSLGKYLVDISKMDMIAPEEEVRLAQLIRNGDKKALECLVKANLRFVVSVAKQYQGQGLSLCDLINEGNIGLMKAAQRFDDSRGFKFISFAVWWIRQSILQAITEHAKMIRLPHNKMVLKNRIKNSYSALEQELGRAPSVEEVAEVLNLKAEEVSLVLELGNQHVSLDAPFSEEEDGSLMDTLQNHNAVSTDEKLSTGVSLKEELRRSLQTLDSRQKEMICYFFGIGVDYPLSLEAIAMKFDLTPERVRQIKDKAISKLRANKNVHLLQAYLAQ